MFKHGLGIRHQEQPKLGIRGQGCVEHRQHVGIVAQEFRILAALVQAADMDSEDRTAVEIVGAECIDTDLYIRLQHKILFVEKPDRLHRVGTLQPVVWRQPRRQFDNLGEEVGHDQKLGLV